MTTTMIMMMMDVTDILKSSTSKTDRASSPTTASVARSTSTATTSAPEALSTTVSTATLTTILTRASASSAYTTTGALDISLKKSTLPTGDNDQTINQSVIYFAQDKSKWQ